MKQTVLTFITAINPDKRVLLDKILKEIRDDLYGNPYIPFQSLSLLHFASFVIVDSSQLLVFEANFDGDLTVFLAQLNIIAKNGLDQIYNCCTDYKGDIPAYLKTKVQLPNAYHVGNVGRTAKQITANRTLRQSLQNFLDTVPKTTAATQIRADIQTHALSVDPSANSKLPPHQQFLDKVLHWSALILVGLFIIALIPLLLILAIVLRYKENHDPVQDGPPSVTHIQTLTGTENRITQNHLAVVTEVKPGLFRLATLTGVLFVINRVARIATKGKLSGIPSIHFAHWSIINKGKQLLFLSNYDGSWTSYLDDFIDKASKGLTGIWSNTQGFPYTKYLAFEGAKDEIRFKAYSRHHQVPSLVWYSAYADLTVQNIDKDSEIREKLFTTLTIPEQDQWLQLF
jgi:hypothetical protein